MTTKNKKNIVTAILNLSYKSKEKIIKEINSILDTREEL